MTAPRTTIWPADPHTLAKHDILRGYLKAWFPILGQGHRRVVYLDGFAGPGRYSAGEEGSPLIALRVALEHRAKLAEQLVFIFVEQREDRAAWLRDREIPAMNLPKHFTVHVHAGQFAPVLREVLDELDARGLRMAPTFGFIDPFGVSGVPFSLMERLLRRQSCEVLVTFMTSAVQRFVTELSEQINDLIGNPEAAEQIAKSADRVVAARKLYEQSLRRVARYVRFFELRDAENRAIYDLFFATNHPLGHEKMKEAMWKVDASGNYSFSDGVDPTQQTLFGSAPGADLAPKLWQHFRGRTVYTDDVYLFVAETAYARKHAREALALLETAAKTSPQRIAVEPRKRDGKRRLAGSFPEGILVRFSGNAGAS